MNLSLPLAIFLALFECLLGFMLWLGVAKKFTLINLFGLILFFSFLTFYSAYFNKVTDCGCFGDVMPLTHWQSFGKNILLLFFILSLIVGRTYIYPTLKKGIRTIFLLIILTALSATAYRGIAHLPIIDFRPYAVGKSIAEQIKTAEELGLEPPKYQILYTLKNIRDKSEKIFTDKEYIDQKFWKNPHWQIQPEKTTQKKIKNGYEAPIHDFVLRKDKQDVTEEILNGTPSLARDLSRFFKIRSSRVGKTENIHSSMAEIATTTHRTVFFRDFGTIRLLMAFR